MLRTAHARTTHNTHHRTHTRYDEKKKMMMM
jgi:hypothetical protein